MAWHEEKSRPKRKTGHLDSTSTSAAAQRAPVSRIADRSGIGIQLIYHVDAEPEAQSCCPGFLEIPGALGGKSESIRGIPPRINIDMRNPCLIFRSWQTKSRRSRLYLQNKIRHGPPMDRKNNCAPA